MLVISLYRMDRQWCVLLKEAQLRDCADTLYGICPIEAPLLHTANDNSCEYAMFIGEDVNAYQHWH